MTMLTKLHVECILVCEMLLIAKSIQCNYILLLLYIVLFLFNMCVTNYKLRRRKIVTSEFI